MDITYREMQEKDRSELIQLFADFCDLYEELDAQGINITSDKLAEWCLDDMMKEIHKTQGQVIVAEYKNHIIGFVGYMIKDAKGDELLYHRPNRVGMIYNLYMDSPYRNKNIGTHLLNLAEEYFRKHNCEFSKLQVFGTNIKAQEFYSRNEYAPRNIDLIKKL
jgi:ribosomal protein S18 acetylase RimI-like enzyme